MKDWTLKPNIMNDPFILVYHLLTPWIENNSYYFLILKKHRHLELNGSLEMTKSLQFIIFEKQKSGELKQISLKKNHTDDS